MFNSLIKALNRVAKKQGGREVQDQTARFETASEETMVVRDDESSVLDEKMMFEEDEKIEAVMIESVRVEVVQIEVSEKVTEEREELACIPTRPGTPDKTRRRHRKQGLKMTTYFQVAADAPPVPVIPAKYLQARSSSATVKTDIAFPTAATIAAPASPVKNGSAIAALIAISEEDEEEDEEPMEIAVEVEEVKYKEVKSYSPVIEYAPLRDAELVIMNRTIYSIKEEHEDGRPARPTTRPGRVHVQHLIRQWEAQQGTEKDRKIASGVWWL